MTAPTHMAFGILWAASVQAGYGPGAAAAIGALLPDLDHTESALGRVFFFLSHPLNSRFGHRGLIHSFIIWLPFIIIGVFTRQEIILWLGLGAWSHVLIDCFNVSGVRAFLPFTDRSVVCFKRDWRVTTASAKELVICLVFVSLVGMSGYAHALGGWRKLTNMLVRSPKIAAEEYSRAGLKVCRIDGKFRWSDGRTESVNWLVVGTEGKHLVCWNGERLVRNPRHGAFLTAKLKEQPREWPSVQVKGFCEVDQPSFFFDGKTWLYARTGNPAFGTVKAVSGEIPVIKTADDPLSKIVESVSGDGGIRAEFVNNYDGDTITVDIPGFPPIIGSEMKIRLAGIDTPEIKGSDGNVKVLAEKASDLTQKLCKEAHHIELRNLQRGKYFRFVADVIADGVNVSDQLIAEKLAKPYNGGRKEPWSEADYVAWNRR